MYAKTSRKHRKDNKKYHGHTQTCTSQLEPHGVRQQLNNKAAASTFSPPLFLQQLWHRLPPLQVLPPLSLLQHCMAIKPIEAHRAALLQGIGGRFFFSNF